MNNRRKLIVALGAGVLATPLASLAQQKGKVWRVGYLSGGSASSPSGTSFLPFLQGMRELGYVEGKNLLIERRFADGEYERLPGFATELVNLKVDVIVTANAPATSAAQKATTTIPIVMASGGDPVGTGFAKSLARPGGNITGVTNIYGDIGAKHLEILLGMVPKLARVAFMMNPGSPGHLIVLKSIQTAAQRKSVVILPVEARSTHDIEVAFSSMAREKVGAVIVPPAALFSSQRRNIAELAAKYRLPSISVSREYAEAGGLLAYGASVAELPRRVAAYVDKIFKGANPSDLPVEQPMRFELVINAKTGKALGLTIPQELLIMADKLIE